MGIFTAKCGICENKRFRLISPKIKMKTKQKVYTIKICNECSKILSTVVKHQGQIIMDE